MYRAIKINSRIYSLDAIKRACYDLSSYGAYSIKEDNPGEYCIIFDLQDNTTPIENIFNKYLLEHQVRIDTEKQFKTVRELIITQAFAPCDNLKDIVSKIEDNE